MKELAKDPVCGMVVEESPDAITYESKGTKYYFCSGSCYNEFIAPEMELARLRKLVGAGAVLTVPILLLTYLPVFSGQLNNFILLALSAPVQLVVGSRFYRGAYHALKARTTNMDFLIAMGTTAAFLYSAAATFYPGYLGATGVYFDAAAVIVTLVLLGRLLEHVSRERASEAVRSLLDLRPLTAHVVSDGSARDVPVEELQKGDLFEVRPGEKVPTDGLVIEGSTEVNESMITGESMPVQKGPGDTVIGGTININGRIVVRAKEVGENTVLAQIAKLVQQAQAGKARVQKLADRVAEYFVPAVLAAAVVSSVLWKLIGGVPFSVSLLIFVSVVIIACPCALGIATPAALLVGTANGARNGILIKGGESVEAASRIEVVVFDKTGTLTRGTPRVVSVIADNERELLRLAASVESHSEHTIGKAVTAEAESRGIALAHVDGFRAHPGMGVEGYIDGKHVKVGRKEFALPNGGVKDESVTKLEEEGSTVVYVSSNGLSGAIAVGDELKPDAASAVSELKKMGIEVVMLTGDSPRAAGAVARKLGINRVYAGLLPHEKVRVIEELQASGVKVAMVGDGINDAPALAKADLGIAIGSGTDVAKETGGIVLIKDRLMDVPNALRIGRATMSKIKQNLFWAFGYNAALIPVAAGALIPVYGVSVYSFLPFLAGAAMAFSSATVVGNSLLLSRFKPVR